MAVKIVKPPKPREEETEKPKKVTCQNPGCNAVLSYVESDVRHFHGMQMNPFDNDYDYIMCPCCNKIVYLRMVR